MSLPSPPASSRAATSPADDAFLDELYASTRLAEVLGWGFSPAEAAIFLRDQARLQRQSHALHTPRAEHRILLADGVPAGRIIVNDDSAAGPVAIIDLAVLPCARGRGLATWAVAAVLERAGAAGRRVELRVKPDNPARYLYGRLGFRALAEDDMHLHLGWGPSC
ncbi:MAG: GNAT family N-acetyltransferase [Myxococcales bacterium]